MIRVIENLSEFVYETVPEGTIVKCRITRNRKGMDKGKLSRENFLVLSEVLLLAQVWSNLSLHFFKYSLSRRSDFYSFKVITEISMLNLTNLVFYSNL